MTQQNYQQEVNHAGANFDPGEETEKFFFQLGMHRRTSGKLSLVTQDLDRIFAEIVAAEVERASLLRQLDRTRMELNSTVIGENHKKAVIRMIG